MVKILIVDDNSLERRLICHILSETFKDIKHVDEADNGKQAISYLQKVKYNIVITDIVMPEIDGISLIRYIKENHHDTKLIAISGSKPYYLYLAKQFGINAMYTKPIDKESFIFSINLMLNKILRQHKFQSS